MVAFDFPEITHNARDEFRGILKRIGFVCHQQSVWCINKDVGNGVKRIIGLLGVKKWVRVYRSVEYL
jgi:hypothetical protein